MSSRTRFLKSRASGSRPVPASVSCPSEDEWGSRWAGVGGPRSAVEGHGQQREGVCVSHTAGAHGQRGVRASPDGTGLTAVCGSCFCEAPALTQTLPTPAPTACPLMLSEPVPVRGLVSGPLAWWLHGRPCSFLLPVLQLSIWTLHNSRDSVGGLGARQSLGAVQDQESASWHLSQCVCHQRPNYE